MTTVMKAADLAVPRGALGRQEVLRGLYWQEWFAHGSDLLILLSVWVMAQWVLMIFFHPLWVLGFGTFVAVWLGAGFAGADAHEGAEEYAFALPATRSQRYFVRLSMSLSVLVFLVGMSLLAIGLDLPQKFWGLVVETGFTAPFPPGREAGTTISMFYWLAAICPLAAYGVSFAMASLACTRDHVALAGSFGLIYTAVGMGIGLWLEGWLWRNQQHDQNGQIAVLILASLAVLYVPAGFIGYHTKDGITRPRGAKSPEWRVAVWLAVGFLILLALVPVVINSWGVVTARW